MIPFNLVDMGAVYTSIACANKEWQLVEYNSSTLKGLKSISSYCAHAQNKQKFKNSLCLVKPFQITFLVSHLGTHGKMHLFQLYLKGMERRERKRFWQNPSVTKRNDKIKKSFSLQSSALNVTQSLCLRYQRSSHLQLAVIA